MAVVAVVADISNQNRAGKYTCTDSHTYTHTHPKTPHPIDLTARAYLRLNAHVSSHRNSILVTPSFHHSIIHSYLPSFVLSFFPSFRFLKLLFPNNFHYNPNSLFSLCLITTYLFYIFFISSVSSVTLLFRSFKSCPSTPRNL